MIELWKVCGCLIERMYLTKCNKFWNTVLFGGTNFETPCYFDGKVMAGFWNTVFTRWQCYGNVWNTVLNCVTRWQFLKHRDTRFYSMAMFETPCYSMAGFWNTVLFDGQVLTCRVICVHLDISGEGAKMEYQYPSNTHFSDSHQTESQETLRSIKSSSSINDKGWAIEHKTY